MRLLHSATQFMDDTIFGEEDKFWAIFQACRALSFIVIAVVATSILALGTDSPVGQTISIATISIWFGILLFWLTRIPVVRRAEGLDISAFEKRFDRENANG